MSEHNFRDPKSFVPERWLGDGRFISDDKKSLQPFFFGPRDCLGKRCVTVIRLLKEYCMANQYSLAYAEVRLILARMIWNFDMELQKDSHRWSEGRKAFTTWEKGSLNVRLMQVVR